MKKDNIKLAFSRHASKYDNHSFVQKELGDKLLNVIQKHRQFLNNPLKVLDVGCGTCLWTSRLKDSLEKNGFDMEITGLDFSKQMLKLCSQRLPNARIIESDMDQIDSNQINSFNLIVSNASIQWSEDLPTLIKKLRNISTDNSVLAFSTFLRGTLEKLSKAIIISLEKEIPAIRFLSYESVIQYLMPYYKIIDARHFSFEIKFNSALELLKHIKHTGTYEKGVLNKPLTRRQITKLEKYIVKENKKLSLSYKAGIFFCVSLNA